MRRIVPTFLVCAAVFTFVAAQTSTFDSDTESSFGSYDIGTYSSSNVDDSGGASAEGSSDGAGSIKKSAGKQSGEKMEKSARGRRSGQSFSSAFSGPQKSCPVCASPRLKNNQYVDYNSGKIHVCSAACIGRVKRNPAAFAEILVKRGEQLSTP